MFFSMFPSIVYNDKLLVDLSARLQAIEVDDPKFLYDEHIVQNGERPDSLSNRFYGVPYYHWVLLVTNGLTLKTWPKSEDRFASYIQSKYNGTENDTAVWVDSVGSIVPYSFPASVTDQEGNTQKFWFNGDGLGVVQGNEVYSVGGSSKTFLEVEKEKNDEAARIRILDKSFLGQITELAFSLLRR